MSGNAMPISIGRLQHAIASGIGRPTRPCRNRTRRRTDEQREHNRATPPLEECLAWVKGLPGSFRPTPLQFGLGSKPDPKAPTYYGIPASCAAL